MPHNTPYQHKKDKKMSNHTPTPWVFKDLAKEYNDEGSPSYEVCGGDGKTTYLFDDTAYYPSAPSKDDAAHIVKCVNTHEELLGVLEEAREFVDSNSEPWYKSGQELLSRIDKTINEAKGE